MTTWCAALLALLAMDPVAFEQDGVRIEVAVVSQIYTWTVTNVDAPPITGFEIGHHNTYNAQTPDGWTEDSSLERFLALVEDERKGIRPGRSAVFTDTVSSNGAVLGLVPATVRFADGTAVTFDGVWGPVRQPRLVMAVVALTIVAIGLLHALVVRGGGGTEAQRHEGT